MSIVAERRQGWRGENGPDGHQGWYSRGYLPHADFPTLHFITFRLADSVPINLVRQWKAEFKHLDEVQRKIRIWQRTEAFIDCGRGACWLRRPRIAECLTSHLIERHGTELDLKAWTIMPNHVHLLAGLPPGCSLPDFVKSLKGGSARDINKLIGRQGRLWYRDYFDRYIRDESHFANTVRYIENNPVKAGLAHSAEGWPFSSAASALARDAD